MKRKRKTELKKSVEGMLNQLPPELQEAVKSGDMENFMAVVEKMPAEQAKALLDALEPMAAKLGFAPERRKGLDMKKVLRDLDALLKDIAAVA